MIEQQSQAEISLLLCIIQAGGQLETHIKDAQKKNEHKDVQSNLEEVQCRMWRSGTSSVTYRSEAYMSRAPQHLKTPTASPFPVSQRFVTPMGYTQLGCCFTVLVQIENIRDLNPLFSNET